MKYEAVKGGLRIENRGGAGYYVVHEKSDLTAIGRLRQRRFAEQARDELLATGVDFTQESRVIQSHRVRNQWAPVYYKWRARTTAKGDQLLDLDLETFEYYPVGTRYGQLIPNAAQAAEMRELADRLRRNKRTRVDHLAPLGQYLAEFARLGLVIADDGDVIWVGA